MVKDGKSGAGGGGPRKASKAGGGKSGSGKAGGAKGAAGNKPQRPPRTAMSRHEQRVRSGEAGGEAGVPRAVDRRPDQTAGAAAGPSDARIAWMLDLLAFAGHGRVAAHVDLRASRASMPPVVLADGDGAIVALDDAAALARLASRHRAFSQIAARFAPLVLAGRERGRPLVIELWDLGALLDGQPAVARLAETAVALARYLGADVSVPDGDVLQQRLATLREAAAAEVAATTELPAAAEVPAGDDDEQGTATSAAFPSKLRERNPLAWLLAPRPICADVSNDTGLARLTIAAADAVEVPAS